eukprot:GHVR01023425.1.p1 GENE.GHVR01023425.1~~GHVR01023425.1.p1  ORF type:complete len:254 (+),score=32.00 GHVR01023425.1:56-817(+)
MKVLIPVVFLIAHVQAADWFCKYTDAACTTFPTNLGTFNERCEAYTSGNCYKINTDVYVKWVTSVFVSYNESTCTTADAALLTDTGIETACYAMAATTNGYFQQVSDTANSKFLCTYSATGCSDDDAIACGTAAADCLLLKASTLWGKYSPVTKAFVSYTAATCATTDSPTLVLDMPTLTVDTCIASTHADGYYLKFFAAAHVTTSTTTTTTTVATTTTSTKATTTKAEDEADSSIVHGLSLFGLFVVGALAV